MSRFSALGQESLWSRHRMTVLDALYPCVCIWIPAFAGKVIFLVPSRRMLGFGGRHRDMMLRIQQCILTSSIGECTEFQHPPGYVERSRRALGFGCRHGCARRISQRCGITVPSVKAPDLSARREFSDPLNHRHEFCCTPGIRPPPQPPCTRPGAHQKDLIPIHSYGR
jgi:hypothetical protein